MRCSPSFTAEEISALAQTLKSQWRPGALIDPWLRANADMLSALVKDRQWSWNAVAAAMTEASIIYRTGNPWSGQTLRLQIRKVSRPSTRPRAAPPDNGAIGSSSASATVDRLPAPDRTAQPAGLRRVRVPVSKKAYLPPPPLSTDEQAQREQVLTDARKAMRGED
jgi:hypothetical protein